MKSDLENALSTISIEELTDRISAFESSQFKIDYKDSLALLKKAILFDFYGIKISAFKSEVREYKEGTIFYRVRKITQENINLDHSDFWEPPKQVIKRGRINRPLEQLLYMSPKDVKTPISEARIEENDTFLLIAYQTIHPLNIFGIGVGGNFHSEFSPDTEKKLDIISEFIKRNFLKSSSSAYVLSNVIAQEICRFDYDGWVYPSVANEGGENVCLKLPAKKKLKIHSAYLCRYTDEKILPMYSIIVSDEIHIYNDWNATNSFAYKVLNSLLSLSKVDDSGINKTDDIDYQFNFLNPS